MTPAMRKQVDLVKTRIRLLDIPRHQLFAHLHSVEKFPAGAILTAMKEMDG